MIKVIKHGTKVFKATCPICGCEFEYEYEDLKKEFGITKICCPDCGEVIYHKEYKEQPIQTPTTPTINEPWDPITKPYITWVSLDCEKCPNKAFKDKLVVGDTPCTWCPNNSPYCNSIKLDTENIDSSMCTYTVNEGKTHE